MNPKVSIIGAGVAGLTAAIHARSSGFDVDLFERHTIAGGLCTSWRTDGYLFDGCVEFFVGSGPSSPFHALWREVGVVPRAFVDREIYSVTTGDDGTKVFLYADPDRLQAHFDSISPADRAPTAQLAGLVRTMRRAKYRVDRAPELMTFGDKIGALLDAIPSMRVWRDGFASSLATFAARFQSPALRAALTHAIPAELPLLFLVQVLADMANGAAGVPLGGSIGIAQSMARRARSLGVKMHMGTEVRRIEIAGERAVGLVTAEGQRWDADVVIAAGDLRATLDRLLDGRFPSPSHEAEFERPLVPSVCIISCGLRATPAIDVPALVHRHVLARPIDAAGHALEVLAWRSFAHDPSMATPPKTTITVTVPSPWGAWQDAASDRARYDARRAELGAAVVRAMNHAIEGFSDLVETVDVATPVTVTRYTANHGGHYMTFVPRPGRPPNRPPRTVPGLAGLYLAGMWVEPPGGLPNALRSGRDVVQVICRDRRRAFVPCAAEVRECYKPNSVSPG